MGKGSRNRTETAEIKERLQKEQDEEKAKKAKKVRTVLLSVIAVMLSVAIVLVSIILVGVIKDAGIGKRNTIVAESEHFSVSVTMAQYFFYTSYNEFITQNVDYLDDISLDTEKSLKDQPCYYNNEVSWFTYFVDNTREEIEMYLALAEKSISVGMEVSDSTEKEIEKGIEDLKPLAENSDMSFKKYLKKNFGTGFRESDLREALTLYYTARQYYNEYYDALTVTEEDFEAYAAENKNDIYSASYYAVPIDAVYNVTTATEEQVEAAVRKAKSTAEYIASAPTDKEFMNRAREYLESTGIGDDEVESTLEEATYDDVNGTDANDVEKWVFDLSRKLGDHTVIDATESEIAVRIVIAPHRSETKGRNFYHIEISDAKVGTDEANKLVTEILSAVNSDKTVDNFVEYANEYTEDSAIYYKNIEYGDVENPLNSWIWGDGRKIGDLEDVYEDGIHHILWYVSNGLSEWQVEADEEIRLERTNEYVDEIIKELKVEYDKSGYDKIDI